MKVSAVRMAVESGDLEAFTDAVQRFMATVIFNEDGTAKDIRRWRQTVRDDALYAERLMAAAPEIHRMVTGRDTTDEEVQALLREAAQNTNPYSKGEL